VGGRMDTLQCAVVLGKLDRFEWELQRRAELGDRYARLLAAVPGLQRVSVRPDRQSVWAQVTVCVERRAAVQAALQAEGIPTAVHYPVPLDRQPAYAAFGEPGGCPVSQRASEQVLSLPMSADLTESDQDRVVRALAQAVAATSLAV
jgi:UDP-2-acetamido-2-deoxy-ribo-hexuluronate aminotransferase